jgi:putative addiction module component (TIGR02574 family)
MATVLLTWEELLEQALRLPPDEQERIARALYENLADQDEEDEDDDPADVEAAWAEEIGRRVEEIRNGTVETIPAGVRRDEGTVRMKRSVRFHPAARREYAAAIEHAEREWPGRGQRSRPKSNVRQTGSWTLRSREVPTCMERVGSSSCAFTTAPST